MVGSRLLVSRCINRLFLLINRLELISQIVALEICLVLSVPLFALSSMKFFSTCLTARPLSSVLLCNGLKPFPTNTAGTFPTYILCHVKISSVKTGQKIYGKRDFGKQRRGLGGIAGYNFFFGGVWRRGIPVTVFRH